MPRIRSESGPRGVDHITIPHEKMRESGWEVGDEVTFNWDGKRMILTKLPKVLVVSKAPAEVEISAEMNAQESPDKTTNIMTVPAMAERPGVPGALSADPYHRTCPKCHTRLEAFQSRCYRCGVMS